MKNLRDLKVKLGDIVYFSSKHSKMVDGWADFFKNYEDLNNYTNGASGYGQIIKIERPVKYETVYEAPKPILDKEEKEYLENVIRPFKDRVKGIRRTDGYTKQFIIIEMISEKDVSLPYFKAGSMYKGMELCKSYTIEELGLFQPKGR